MLTALGHHCFDSTHRAVILGLVVVPTEPAAAAHRAEAVVSARPDGLFLVPEAGAEAGLAPAVASVAGAGHPPVVVRTSDADVLRTCLESGACAGHDPSGLVDPAYLAVAREADASVVVGRPLAGPGGRDRHTDELAALAARAHDAGVDRERIVVDVSPTGGGVPPGGVAALAEAGALARAGWSVLVEVDAPGAGPDRDLLTAAGAAVAVELGARVLATADVHGTRRVVAVMAELLRARETSGPPGDDAEVLV